ncbi:MAG: vitamin B12-dependent ribonucleotide reductase [Verrucomicrobia bacterium]|nr:vitamin B12-dependent ribonucleotide reductase [Verrucomicrobiota bacterium]
MSSKKKNIQSDNDGTAGGGLTVKQVFSTAGVHPFDELEWERRTAEISDDGGKAIFKQENVEVPKGWSVLATKVVVSKYFYGELGTPERETSVKQLVHRVARTIADCGVKDGYFRTPEDGETFYQELAWLCVNQYGSFNSPVWFNVGLYHQYGIGKNSCPGNWHYNAATGEAQRASTQYEFPQGSACFIQSVRDTMEDIMRLAGSEAMLFKFGSGTGTDLSPLRSSREKLSGGGRPSGPLSFLKVYDQIANVVKSGGKTRRAAKMNTLKDWHPDILDFIECKAKEEKKAWALIEQGYDANFNGDAYGSIMYQNENLTVRASDAFMQAAVEDKDWTTHWVTDRTKAGPTYKGRELLRKIAEGTHICGDPGMQFDGTIQRWHTCKNTEPINSTNPCSEYVFIDNTACNLASLNLMKFRRDDGTFDVERFKAAVRIFIIAQEIIVDNASYPTKEIAENSHIFRTLGLGYANLGALIMAEGTAYDSNEGRALAGAITAIMTGQAYEVSAELAAAKQPFPGYFDARCAHVLKPIGKDNRDCMLDVIRLHRSHVAQIDASCPKYLRDQAQHCWNRALAMGEKHGYRNAQVSVLAPTGTIAFMMDCDTTGIEPDIALVKYKLLAGGGILKIVNRTVPMALEELGYSEDQAKDIVEYIDQNDTIEGAPHLKEEHLSVFDCAFKAQKGTRSLHYMAHLRMMAAAQPFISGAISKTVNMPETATIEDIITTYVEGWKLGLKAIAIYRDGSKRSAPMSTKKGGATGAKDGEDEERDAMPQPFRRRMPETRMAVTHKFDIAGHEGYLHVGLFEDHTPGELFITMAKEGSTIGGLMDTIGTLTSLALQYGVPIDALVKKFAHQRFEPSGFTKNPDIRTASSIVDYVFRWLGCQFIPGFREATNPGAGQQELPMKELEEAIKKKVNRPVADLPRVDDVPEPAQALTLTPPSSNGKTHVKTLSESVSHFMKDAPTCPNCGHIVVRNGACFKCLNCGESLGCS